MSNSNVTSKIVVGSGLAVVCAIGVSVFTIQARQELAKRAAFTVTAPDAAASAASPATLQDGADALAPVPAAAMPPPVDQGAIVASEPLAAVSAATRAAPRGAVSKLPQERKTPRASREQASPAEAVTTPADPAPASVLPAAAAPTDSQILASARAALAAVVPDGKVDLASADGAVTLAGSVPNADAIVQARQAIELIDGVRSVDTTAVTVSQQ